MHTILILYCWSLMSEMCHIFIDFIITSFCKLQFFPYILVTRHEYEVKFDLNFRHDTSALSSTQYLTLYLINLITYIYT